MNSTSTSRPRSRGRDLLRARARTLSLTGSGLFKPNLDGIWRARTSPGPDSSRCIRARGDSVARAPAELVLASAWGVTALAREFSDRDRHTRQTTARVPHPRATNRLSRSKHGLRVAHTPRPREAAPASGLQLDELELLRCASPGSSGLPNGVGRVLRGSARLTLAGLAEPQRIEPRVRVRAHGDEIGDETSTRLVVQVVRSRDEICKGTKVFSRHGAHTSVSGPRPCQERCGAIYWSAASCAPLGSFVKRITSILDLDA